MGSQNSREAGREAGRTKESRELGSDGGSTLPEFESIF